MSQSDELLRTYGYLKIALCGRPCLLRCYHYKYQLYHLLEKNMDNPAVAEILKVNDENGIGSYHIHVIYMNFNKN